MRANRIVVSLAEFYASNGGWDGAQSFVNRISFQTERVSMSSVKVRANWPAKMSHHGECDIDAERAE